MFNLEMESVFFRARKVVLFRSIADGFVHPVAKRKKMGLKEKKLNGEEEIGIR